MRWEGRTGLGWPWPPQSCRGPARWEPTEPSGRSGRSISHAASRWSGSWGPSGRSGRGTVLVGQPPSRSILVRGQGRGGPRPLACAARWISTRPTRAGEQGTNVPPLRTAAHKHLGPSQHSPSGGGEAQAPKAALSRDVNAAVSDRLIEIMSLPVQSPAYTKKMERQSVPLDHDTYFRTRPRTIANYKTLLRAQAGQVPLGSVLDTYRRMQDIQLRPEHEIYTTLITACSYEGNISEAEAFITEMKQKVLEVGDASLTPTVWTYTALAKVYCKAGQLDRAFDVLDRVNQEGLKPDVVLYTTLIHGCIYNGNIDRAWETFDNMRIQAGIEPDAVTYSVMIHACAQRKEVERAGNIMEEMKLLDLYPTEVTYNSHINACAERTDYFIKAFEVHSQMKARGYQPTIETFGTLLKAAARNADVKAAELVWDEMIANQKAVGAPNLVIWNTLLAVYSNAQQNANALDRAENIRKAHIIVNKIVAAGLRPDLLTVNTVLAVYARAHFTRTALAFFRQNFRTSPAKPTESKDEPTSQALVVCDPEREPFTPDVTSFTTLIQMCADTKKPDEALALWKEMKEGMHRIVPTMRTYEYLVLALMKGHYRNTGMKMLREMRAKGFIPSAYVVKVIKSRMRQHPSLLEEVNRLTAAPPHIRPDPLDTMTHRIKRVRKRDGKPLDLGFLAPALAEITRRR